MRPNTLSSWLVRIVLVLAFAISACVPHMSPKVGTQAPGQPGAQTQPASSLPVVAALPVGHSTRDTIVGKVESPEGRTVAALASEVASGSTITLIDTQFNTPAAVTKTDAAGNFSLALAGFTPRTNIPYVLEAVKDLGNNKPGANAARLRTIILWNGTDWLSISNALGSGQIMISSLTTAVAIISALDPVGLPPANTIGKVSTATNPASLAANPFYPAHPNSEISAMSADLTNFLTGDIDPVAAVGSIAPVITGLFPALVQANYLIAINGSGFSPRIGDNTVTLGALACTVLAARGDQIIAQVPSNAVTGDLKVVTARGTSNLQAVTIVLAEIPMPVITGVSQLETVTGKKLTLFGQNFTAPATVTFTTAAGVVVAVPTNTDANSLVVTVPATAVAGFVTVTTPAGTTNKVYFSLVVVVPGVPTILGASHYDTVTGKVMTLFGANFTSPATVTFTTGAGTVDAVPSSTDASSIVVTIPPTAVGGNVKVTTATGTSNRVFLAINAPIVPTISGVSQIETVAGKTLTIFGENFSAGATVTFTSAAGTVVANPTSAEVSSIVVAIPGTAVAGNMTVTTAAGTSNKVFLALVAASSLIPTIQGVSGLETGPGKTMNLFGENFTVGATVKFTTAAGTTTVVPTSAEANSIAVVVPVTAVAGPVTVTTAAGTSNKVYMSLSSGQAGVPIILGINPLEAVAGRTITIFGQYFTSGSAVNFKTSNGTTAVVPDSAEANSILVVVPTSAVPGPLTVTTLLGTSNKVFMAIYVTISALSAASGPTGSSLTINGSGFANPTVTIGGVQQTVDSSSNTAISITIADATLTGIVVVKTPYDSGTGPIFQVKPNITSISPNSGPSGSEITVNGTGFHNATDPSGGVLFGNAVGSIVSWANTKIVCTANVTSQGLTTLTVRTAFGTSNGKSYTINASANRSHFPWDTSGAMHVGTGYGGRKVRKESSAGSNSYIDLYDTPNMSGRTTFDVNGNLWSGGMTSGGVITRFNKGGGTSTTSFSSGAFGLAVDQAGNGYVGTWSSLNLYKIDASSFAVSVVTSTGYYASGLAVDINGDIYWSGQRNGQIMKWTKSNGQQSTLNSNIPGSVAQGLAFGPDGQLYCSPSYSSYIYKIDKSGGGSSQWANIGRNYLSSIAVKDNGDVYVGATGSSQTATMYKITPSGQVSSLQTFSSPCGWAGSCIGLMF